ncbi:MAG: acetate/propionate family kinase [bacterium]
MDVLVLNAGSSSLKFELYRTSLSMIEDNTDHSMAEGLVERIGLAGAEVTFEHGDRSYHNVQEILNHRKAIEIGLDLMMDDEIGPISDQDEIDAVGHRVVHGGESFSETVIIDQDVETEIQKCIRFAPLHNPHNLEGIRAAREIFPDVPHAAAFDTGVHQSLPEKSYLYAIPRNFYHEHDIRKYGFHGMSHRYMRFRLSQLLDKPRSELQFISCHLGNGCSVTAFDGMQVLDTSMGFTPLEGLVMGTRCGDLDPAVVIYLMVTEDYLPHEMDTLLNKQSGLQGLSGVTNDMKTLLDEASEGNHPCQQAIDVFCHRLQKYIGAYHGFLNGADAILFTGGIGTNSPDIRRQSLEEMDNLGIQVDPDRNAATTGEEGFISPPDANVKVGVIPTEEELVIARDTVRCLRNGE